MKKHIVVKPETKAKFERLKDAKGMTQDGLINYLLNQDELRYNDGR